MSRSEYRLGTPTILFGALTLKTHPKEVQQQIAYRRSYQGEGHTSTEIDGHLVPDKPQ